MVSPYFLGKFALKESSGKGKGEFYTPKTIVNLIAELIEPYKGIIYEKMAIIDIWNVVNGFNELKIPHGHRLWAWNLQPRTEN